MGWAERLEEYRVQLSDVPVDDLCGDWTALRGACAERMVAQWLSRCPGLRFDTDLPRSAGEYQLTPRGLEVLVTQNNQTVHEYDMLLFDGERPVIVEVKSLDLNGYEGKIEKAFRIARSIYARDDVEMLVFFPAYHNKRRDIARLESHAGVACIDLGYKKKQLKHKLEDLPSLQLQYA